MHDTPEPYLIPAGAHRVEELIQRSRFITTGARAGTAEDAKAFVENIRIEFSDATHNCWAFVAGPPGSSASIGMSDDGEPHGTAGRPMLTTLMHSGVGEIVAVCTRYYGGIKLGTGGLSRAYSGGVKLLLESLPTELLVERIDLMVIVDYGAVDPLQRALSDLEAEIRDQAYGEQVEYVIRLPLKNKERLGTTVADLTRGAGIVRVL
jgi:uncharacterized YigZ family protein